MENKKNNVVVILLIFILIIILTVLCVLFFTGTISFNSKNQTIIDNNNIITKLVDNLNDGDSETTFNGISVKVTQKNEDMVCILENISINGIDVSKYVGHCIESYEFYDDNVIIFSSHTSGTDFAIFNVISDSVELELSSSINSVLNGYFVKSYSTNGNIITINAEGCGLQCGVDNEGDVAIFEIEYLNKSFSNPKLKQHVQSNNTNTNDKINIDLSIANVTVLKDSPNAKISVTGTIDISYDNNIYAGITLSGYCLGMDNEKYLIWGPGDGKVLFNNGINNNLTLTEVIPQNIEYSDGTVKMWSEIDWSTVNIRYCKIDKMTAISNDGTNNSETVLNVEKEFK